jgi:hypothetical protein
MEEDVLELSGVNFSITGIFLKEDLAGIVEADSIED